MAKDLSEIEDEYKTSYENITEDFSKGIREGGDHSKLRKKYKKNFQKILKKRNDAYSKYVKNHKQELLGMPEKKKKKEEKKGVYKAYHIDFEQSFSTRFKRFLKKIWFNFSLFFRNVRYNFIPSWLKFAIFRIKLFLSSVFSDVSLFFRGIKLNIFRIFNRIFERMKEKVLTIVSKIKEKLNKISEWNKARIEKKKKVKEEEEKKKMEEKSEESEKEDKDGE